MFKNHESITRTKADMVENESGYISAKKILNNTLELKYPDKRVIKFHETYIFTEKGNQITLNSGGWKTRTTKERLNDLILQYGFYLHQEKSIWYIGSRKIGKTVVFFDGIKISKNGRFLNLSKGPKNPEQKTKALKKRIKKFVDQINKDNLESFYPNNGDCLLCRMDQTSCLDMHIKENYMHGSLIFAAMRAAGYSDQNTAFHFQLKLTDTIKRNLKKYLFNNLSNF